MTRIQIIAALAVLLLASVLTNLWQLRLSGKADGRCETAQAKAETAVLTKAAERDTKAIDVAAEAKAEAEDAVAEVQTDSIERQEVIRVVYRTLPPADPVCPVALPERVRDTLSEGVAAANRAGL